MRSDSPSLSLMIALCSAAPAWAAPIEQHLSASGGGAADPTNSIDVVWSDSACTAGSVQYGPSAAYGSTLAESGAPLTVPGETVCSHHVQITGLSAGTLYHYSAGGGADHTFTTASSSGSLVFVAYGDQGSSYTLGTGPGGGCPYTTTGGGGGVNGAPESTALQASQVGASVALYLGDCSYGSGTSLPWDQWFTANTPLAADRAWLATVGNHDEAGGQGPGTAMDGQNFFGRFFYPAPFSPGNGWWSLDYEGVHFIFLSGDFYSNAQQLAWLNGDLTSSAAKSANWRIAVVHQPAYNSSCYGGDPYENGVRGSIVPVFDSYATTAHVDLVLQGHRHVYERTYMLQGGGPTVDTASYDSATKTYTMSASAGVGTVYVTTGAGGHSLHGWMSTTPPSWSVTRNSFFHWMKFVVSPSSMTAEVHDTLNGGATWETFSIARPSTTTCGASNCSGCCGASGCQPGNMSSACGTGGAFCQACSAVLTCTGGSCSSQPDGGMGGVDSGSTSGDAGSPGVPPDAGIVPGSDGGGGVGVCSGCCCQASSQSGQAVALWLAVMTLGGHGGIRRRRPISAASGEERI